MNWGFFLAVCIILTIGITGCIGLAEPRNTTSVMATVPIPESAMTSPPQNGTYWIHIDPVGNKSAGDIFFINGTTNLNVGDAIHIEVYPADFKPSQKLTCSGPTGLFGTTGTIQVFKKAPKNSHQFSFFVDTAHYFDVFVWKPQEYTITAESVVYPVKDQVNFTLISSVRSVNVSYPPAPSCNWGT
jgi:hypothetical protein